MLRLIASDADVWVDRLGIEGALWGTGELAACRVTVGDRSFPATTRGRSLHADLDLTSGSNAIRAFCSARDGRGLSSQVVHYRLRLRSGPIARASAHAKRTQIELDASLTTRSEREPAELVEYAWFAQDASADVPVGAGKIITIERPASAECQRYRLRVTDARGRSDWASTGCVGTTTWPADAVVYGVMPSAFGPEGLPNVTTALAALADLGVNVVWLAPVFGAPPGDFGYAVTDFFHVRPELGGDAALAALIREAHQRGIRVVLDLPANDTSVEHPYFVDQAKRGVYSHYYAFYARDQHGRATHYFDWSQLINLDYTNDEVARFMLEVADYWFREFDVDGYRMDAAWGVRARRADLWPRFTAELRRIRPDALLIAEAPAADPYYRHSGFDAAYDWTTELGHAAWQDVFSVEPEISRKLDTALKGAADSEAAPHVLRFLNNNDTGARFITRHGQAITRLASAALLTLPGIPCLYSFDEVGAEFDPYTLRAPVRVQNPGLRDFHKQWIALRRSHPALYGPSFEPIHAGADGLYAYLRSDADQLLLIVLNFSGRALEHAFTLSGRASDAREFRDLLSDERFTPRERQLQVRMSAWQARALDAQFPVRDAALAASPVN